MTVRIYQGHVSTVLRGLAAGSWLLFALGDIMARQAESQTIINIKSQLREFAIGLDMVDFKRNTNSAAMLASPVVTSQDGKAKGFVSWVFEVFLLSLRSFAAFPVWMFWTRWMDGVKVCFSSWCASSIGGSVPFHCLDFFGYGLCALLSTCQGIGDFLLCRIRHYTPKAVLIASHTIRDFLSGIRRTGRITFRCVSICLAASDRAKHLSSRHSSSMSISAMVTGYGTDSASHSWFLSRFQSKYTIELAEAQ